MRGNTKGNMNQYFPKPYNYKLCNCITAFGEIVKVKLYLSNYATNLM